ARAVAELGPMGLAAVAPAQRLVRQDQLLVHGDAGRWQEEPLALADEGGVLAAVTSLESEALACLGGQHFSRLQRLLGLTDSANRCGFRDAGDEPVALVMAAEKLALVLALSDEQEQMAVTRLNVEDRDLGVRLPPADDL